MNWSAYIQANLTPKAWFIFNVVVGQFEKELTVLSCAHCPTLDVLLQFESSVTQLVPWLLVDTSVFGQGAGALTTTAFEYLLAI